MTFRRNCNLTGENLAISNVRIVFFPYFGSLEEDYDLKHSISNDCKFVIQTEVISCHLINCCVAHFDFCIMNRALRGLNWGTEAKRMHLVHVCQKIVFQWFYIQEKNKKNISAPTPIWTMLWRHSPHWCISRLLPRALVSSAFSSEQPVQVCFSNCWPW